MPSLFSRCTALHSVNLAAENNKLTLPKNEFIERSADKNRVREMVLVRASSLAFPIAVYRNNENLYIALWMECTHKGCEVNAHPNFLVCPCHGSEFDAKGHVIQGPAESNLKTLNITTDHENIYIQL
jgi:cytochrome b6-f complex iron-sulfur subunit